MKHIFSKLNPCQVLFTAALLAIITPLMQSGAINFYYQNILCTIGVNMILVISLNLIIGVAGQFSLGHTGFIRISAYVAAIITRATPSLGGSAFAVVIGGVVSALTALVATIPTLYLKGDHLAVTTLGSSEVVHIVVLNMTITNGAAGLSSTPKLATWSLLLFCLIVFLLVVLNFPCSASGRVCISIREDKITSEAIGINTTKYKTVAFVIGTVLTSLAGALYACSFYVVKLDLFTFSKSVGILILVVFNGMGSFAGPIVAAVVIDFTNTYFQNSADVRTIIYGAALVLITVSRPEDLSGTRKLTFPSLLRRFSKKKGVRQYGIAESQRTGKELWWSLCGVQCRYGNQ